MAYVIVGLLLFLFAAWIWAEYKIETPSTRLAFGGAVIFMLCATIYASEKSRFYLHAHNSAAIRMLGEALEDGDTKTALDAIHEYNAQNPRQKTGYVIVDFLADRKRSEN